MRLVCCLGQNETQMVCAGTCRHTLIKSIRLLIFQESPRWGSIMQFRMCACARVYRDVYVAPTHPNSPQLPPQWFCSSGIEWRSLFWKIWSSSSLTCPCHASVVHSASSHSKHTHTFTYTGYNDSKLHGPVCGLNTPGGQDARKSESNRKHSTVSWEQSVFLRIKSYPIMRSAEVETQLNSDT